MDQRSGDGAAWGPRGGGNGAGGVFHHQSAPEYFQQYQQDAAQAEAERLHAEQIAGQQAWEARFDHAHPRGAAGGLRARGARLANIAGAAMSLALIGGLAVWGYRITVRDVSGVPVVMALEGPMRMAPEDPGGEVADHTGLAVNQVAADGEGPGMSEQITLAPGPVRLTEEDLPLAALAPEDLAPEEEIAAGAAEAGDGDLLAPDVEVAVSLPAEVDPNDPVAVALAMAGQVAAGATPLQGHAAATVDGAKEDEAVDVAAQVAAQVAATSAAGPLAALPGVTHSPRPARRPARVASAARAAAVAREVAAPSAAAVRADAAVATAGTVAPGTRLVQLGAFETADEAAALWGQLNGRFDSLMVEKTRLIMEAESGGKTFYRLRAQGFADLSDARRFCAALVAERAECIPVVAR